MGEVSSLRGDRRDSQGLQSGTVGRRGATLHGLEGHGHFQLRSNGQKWVRVAISVLKTTPENFKGGEDQGCTDWGSSEEVN